MEITKKSILSGKTNTRNIDATEEHFAAWYNGALIQDAFPHLSADDREFIITGITPEEWEEEFGEDSEDKGTIPDDNSCD